MGIHGIYKEIGPGERISLAKLAVLKFEETNRPLRVAIDISIWLFQIQSSKGGSNPALRTFYYRLLRLISLSIHPLFVFDGPNKPPFKRHKRTVPNVASIPEFLAKQLLKQFGIPFHIAPGEAEAECALLQREGIVDAVLSEDVDTLMFGSGLTLRNWSPEPKTAKVASHVNLYDAEKTKETSGLNKEGMVLVALMSGGDYTPEGIPKCGPKLACEAARAGFGSELCSISRKDRVALRAWRERLAYELRTNESKLFKSKHSAVVIPDSFPDIQILGYYTAPVVSSAEKLDKLKGSLRWDNDIDFKNLRTFAEEAFEWCNLGGAKKFIRNLAPALLVRDLRLRAAQVHMSDDLEVVQQEESGLVKGIHGRRTHCSTDSTAELRISFLPTDIVDIDLSQEQPDDVPEEPGSDSEQEALLAFDDDNASTSHQTKGRRAVSYDPTQLERIWIVETIVKVGVPLMAEDWESGLARKTQATSRRKAVAATGSEKASRSRRKPLSGGMPRGALDNYARITKPGTQAFDSRQKGKTREGDAAADQIRPQSGHAIAVAPGSSSQHPPPSLETPSKDVENAVVDLSSPEVPKQILPVGGRPSVGETLAEPGVPTTSTQKRRSPLRRTRTLPADLSTQDAGQYDLPVKRKSVETVDLTASPDVPASSKIPVKTAKRRAERSTTIHASPSAMRQWLQNPGTPKTRKCNAPLPIRLPSHCQPIEELDLSGSLGSGISSVNASIGNEPTVAKAADPFECLIAAQRLARERQESTAVTSRPLRPMSGNISSSSSSSASKPNLSAPSAAVSGSDRVTAAWKLRKEKKRHVQLRESLEGAWKLSNWRGSPDARIAAPITWANADVEILDLAR